MRLFATHDEAVFDYITFRRDLEGMAAERAAKSGTETDLKVVQTVFDKMEEAHLKRNPEEEAELDVEFHLAIVDASHNVVMLHMMRSMLKLLREGVFYNREIMFKQRLNRGMILEQHKAINAALQKRDAKGARAAIESHLNFVEGALRAQKSEQKNEAIARQRFDHHSK